MKLLYIVNARIPTEKAHGYQICKMCEEFSSAGVEVELWVPTRENLIKKNVFEYYNLKRNFKISYIKSFDFIKYDKLLLKKSVYLQSLWFFLKLVFKKLDKKIQVYTRNPELAWFFGKKNPVVFDAHNWPMNKIRLYRFFLKKVDKIVCNSRGTEKKYNEHGFVNTVSVPNGVDLSEFKSEIDVLKLRKELNLPQNKKIVMYIGHLYKWKGVDSIVGAAELMRANKDVLFVVVGGTKEDIKKYNEIIKNKNFKNIIFLGHKNKIYIPKFLQAVDVLLLPNSPISAESVNYTSPIKMFEYMLAGIPVVTSDFALFKEIIENDNCGICVNPLDPKEIALAINRLLGAEKEAEEMGNNGNRMVKEKYNWSIEEKKLFNVYKKITNKIK